MWSQRRAKQIEGRFDIRHPIAHRFIDGVLERPAAAFNRDDLGAEQLHAEDVGPLPADIDAAHVDVTLQAKQSHRSGCADAVLAGARLSDDAALAHPIRQQALPQRIVDLVRAGMRQVFTFEIDLRAAKCVAEPPRVRNRRGAPGVGALQAAQFLVKVRVGHCIGISLFQFVKRRHDRLRYETATKFAEIATRIQASLKCQFEYTSQSSKESPFRLNPQVFLAREITPRQNQCLQNVVINAGNEIVDCDIDLACAQANGDCLDG